MAFTHICGNSDWKLKGETAPGPKEGDRVTALYECKNTSGQAAYRLKEYPGVCFAKIHFKKITQ